MAAAIFGIEGKKAIVVGGGRGMGESSANFLAEAGCDVAVLDVDEGRAQHGADEVTKRGRKGIPIVADMLDAASARDAIKRAEEALGGLDVLVTIVGQAIFKTLFELTDEEWDFDQNRNLRYAYVTATTAAKSMIARKVDGRIVCIASMDGIMGSPFHAAYGAAKAGLISLVKSMADEWGRDGIRVNTVVPGSIATPRLPDNDSMREILDKSPLPIGRSGTTDEIGKAVLFLASDMSSYTTGSAVLVDGGWNASNIFDPRIVAVKKTL